MPTPKGEGAREARKSCPNCKKVKSFRSSTLARSSVKKRVRLYPCHESEAVCMPCIHMREPRTDSATSVDSAGLYPVRGKLQLFVYLFVCLVIDLLIFYDASLRTLLTPRRDE